MVAFCDIAGDGARGLSELGGEAVAFLGGQALCRSIDVETEKALFIHSGQPAHVPAALPKPG